MSSTGVWMLSGHLRSLTLSARLAGAGFTSHRRHDVTRTDVMVRDDQHGAVQEHRFVRGEHFPRISTPKQCRS